MHFMSTNFAKTLVWKHGNDVKLSLHWTNFAKTLVWKHGNDVKLWRHRQRTPNTNDHHMTLNQTPPMKIFCVRHWPLGSRDRINQWKCLTKLINTWVFARLSQSWAFQAKLLNSTVGIPSEFSLIGHIKWPSYSLEIYGLVAMGLLTICVALSSISPLSPLWKNRILINPCHL